MLFLVPETGQRDRPQDVDEYLRCTNCHGSKVEDTNRHVKRLAASVPCFFHAAPMQIER